MAAGSLPSPNDFFAARTSYRDYLRSARESARAGSPRRWPNTVTAESRMKLSILRDRAEANPKITTVEITSNSATARPRVTPRLRLPAPDLEYRVKTMALLEPERIGGPLSRDAAAPSSHERSSCTPPKTKYFNVLNPRIVARGGRYPLAIRPRQHPRTANYRDDARASPCRRPSLRKDRPSTATARSRRVLCVPLNLASRAWLLSVDCLFPLTTSR